MLKYNYIKNIIINYWEWKIMSNNKQGTSKIANFFGYLKRYWKKAPAGRYLSLKEATAYCVGGMGAVGATVVPVYVTLSAGQYIAIVGSEQHWKELAIR